MPFYTILYVYYTINVMFRAVRAAMTVDPRTIYFTSNEHYHRTVYTRCARVEAMWCGLDIFESKILISHRVDMVNGYTKIFVGGNEMSFASHMIAIVCILHFALFLLCSPFPPDLRALVPPIM